MDLWSIHRKVAYANSESLSPTRWSMGRAGTAVNAVALVDIVWAIFESFWPTFSQPTVRTFHVRSHPFCWLHGIRCICMEYLLHAKRYYGWQFAKAEGNKEC